MRMYANGGIILAYPSSQISSTNNFIAGSYSVYGFEFFADNRHFSYFLELGYTYINFPADNLSGDPMLICGFSASVGFRFRL